MPCVLFTTTTPVQTHMIVAAACIGEEDGASYLWLLEKLKEIMAKHSISVDEVHTVLTDNQRALKGALSTALPGARQQLCWWHIYKNVQDHVQKHWPKAKDMPELSKKSLLDAAYSSTETHDTPAEIRLKLDFIPPKDNTAVKFMHHFADMGNQRTRESFFAYWQRFKEVYLGFDTILDFMEKWIVPTAPEWARAWTRSNLNYGLRCTSISESANHQLKTTLRGINTLFGLYKACNGLFDRKFADYQVIIARHANTTRIKYADCPILSLLTYNVSLECLEKLYNEYLKLVPHMLHGEPLEPCTHTFHATLGLPCAHMFKRRLFVEHNDGRKDRLASNAPLQMKDVNVFWHLRRNMVIIYL